MYDRAVLSVLAIVFPHPSHLQLQLSSGLSDDYHSNLFTETFLLDQPAARLPLDPLARGVNF